jgi:integrase
MPRKKAPAPKNENGNGSVWFEKGRGVWRWSLTLGYKPDGSRRQVGGRAASEDDAKGALIQAQAAYLRGANLEPDNVTFEQYATLWLKRQKGIRLATRVGYEDHLNYALEFIGAMKLRKITPLHIREMLSGLADKEMTKGLGQGRTMASRTLTGVLARVRAVFRDAVIDEVIVKNPTLGIKPGKKLQTEHGGIALDFPQFDALRELGEALHDAGVCRLWPAIWTCLTVGLRRGEVMALRWSDLDLKTNTMRVTQSVSIPKGKPVFANGKTPNAIREIPMPSSLVAMLEKIKATQELERKNAGSAWTNTGAVICTELGEYVHPDNLGRILLGVIAWSDPSVLEGRKKRKRKDGVKVRTRKRPLSELSAPERRMFGLPVPLRGKVEAIVSAHAKLPRISPHDLRHTAGTMMLRRGMPVEAVSKILGHANISITYNVYRHVLESEKRAVMVDLGDRPIPVREVVSVLVN